MVIYKCDLCGEIRDCMPRQIEHTEYDICAVCWEALMSKLEGKGRRKPGSPSAEPPSVPELPRHAKERFPGQPPDIIARASRAN